jgi:EAL domain-containing protein (putative c-di-GMP-specific phosphodiesterase class I)
MRDSAADRTIVRTMIELAHGLDLEVIAEGVEDEATLALLREMECDAIQGFLTGRPVPAEDFHWLRDGTSLPLPPRTRQPAARQRAPNSERGAA